MRNVMAQPYGRPSDDGSMYFPRLCSLGDGRGSRRGRARKSAGVLRRVDVVEPDRRRHHLVFRLQESREIDKLHQRVAVLERIATEDSHGRTVAAEIERLRDS